MNDVIKKAFGLITDKVGDTLKSQGFKREKTADTENEMIALFTSDTMAYSVVYYLDKKHVVLRSCSMTDEGPDNEWKSLATWMFDPDSDTQREAESIANDFCDSLSSVHAVKRVKQAKKKKSDDGNADPLFLAKRFVNLFPELRDIIKVESDGYESFRGVTFTRTYVVPKVNALLKNGSKGEKSKLAQLLSTQYSNGDMDTRSIITIVILNSIEEEFVADFEPMLSDELQKSWRYAKKIKGKKIKPEKPKKNLAAYAAERLR